jgi:hypothetical protein
MVSVSRALKEWTKMYMCGLADAIKTKELNHSGIGRLL